MEDVLIGGPEKREIVIVDYNPAWPALFQAHAERIQAALGPRALAIEHIGSTSVPGLAAKPIIDILVVVKDSSDEASYLPALVAAGYVLRVREPNWHEHRMFRTPDRDVHIHIFSHGSVENERQLLFRDRLRTSSEDRDRYEATKRALASQGFTDMNAYATAKSAIIEEIIGRAGSR